MQKSSISHVSHATGELLRCERNALSFVRRTPILVLSDVAPARSDMPSLGVSSLDLGRSFCERLFFYADQHAALHQRLLGRLAINRRLGPLDQCHGEIGERHLQRRKPICFFQADFVQI
jgi:hypothetical protein